MALCVSCGLVLYGDNDFCPHHLIGYAEDWGSGNRLMCDFVHRQLVPPRPSEAKDFFTWLIRRLAMTAGAARPCSRWR